MDLIILIILCISMGKIVREKGRQPLGYQFGVFGVYFAALLVAAIVVVAIIFIAMMMENSAVFIGACIFSGFVGLGIVVAAEVAYFAYVKKLPPLGGAAGATTAAFSNAPPPPHMMGPPVEFKAAGADDKSQQANLIVARSTPVFPLVKELFADAIIKRSAVVMLDYQQQAVGIRYEVDGVWHNIGQRDRPTGDVMLASMKKLADLNVNERRAKQEGKFQVKFMEKKLDCTLLTQGVQTGERVLIKLTGKGDHLEQLEALGMRAKMLEQLTGMLNDPTGGMILVSAAPGQGLTTSFAATLRAADRFTRDFVGFEEKSDRLPYVENINMIKFDKAAGPTPDKLLPSVLLKQPEALVLADLVNKETIDIVSDQAANHQKLVVASIQANEAAEAPLRVLAMKANPEKFAKALKAVLYVRLARRLCETCRQPYPPAPQLLQKLGLPAGRVNMLYKQWEPPPPEQLVDEKGRPIAPPVCPVCSNLGYVGRFAIYELLVLNDKMKQALIRQPKVEVLRKLAAEARHRSLKEEAIAAAARGVTSLAEIQRVLK